MPVCMSTEEIKIPLQMELVSLTNTTITTPTIPFKLK